MQIFARQKAAPGNGAAFRQEMKEKDEREEYRNLWNASACYLKTPCQSRVLDAVSQRPASCRRVTLPPA